MKKILFTVVVLVLYNASVYSQEPVKPASVGFDVKRENIAHGTIDTITYESKTVDAKRRALIYTPPGYSQKKNKKRNF